MTTLARAPRKVKPAFACELISLAVRINGTAYDVETIPAGEFGSKAFRLAKHSSDGAVYDVIRTHDGLVECDCPSYESTFKGNGYGMCKHGKGLVALGLLQAPMGTSNILKPSAEEWADAKAAFAPVVIEQPGVAIITTPAVEPVACCAPAEEIPCIACTAAAPVIDESFLAELDPSWELRPDVDGSGLSPEEFAKVVHRGSKVRAAYLASVPEAGDKELERVERNGRLDGLRSVLKARPVADDVASTDVIPGADEHMTPEELAELEELNRTNPAGTVEANIGKFPAFDVWPDNTSNFYFTPGPADEDEAPRLTLAQLIDQEAARMRRMETQAGDLMWHALAELARVVRVVSADRPDQIAERLSILEGYTESAMARDWEQPEPEIGPSGRWL